MVYPGFSILGHISTQSNGGHAALSGDWIIVVYLYALLPIALLVLGRWLKLTLDAHYGSRTDSPYVSLPSGFLLTSHELTLRSSYNGALMSMI